MTAGTLRRWVKSGLIPHYGGDWTAGAVGHARVISRLRERGHSLQQIRQATEDGRLAFGYLDELLPPSSHAYTLRQASRETGLEPGLIERVVTTVGWTPVDGRNLSESELELLRYVSTALEAGLPLIAMLQLVRVYGQALAQVADAEVRLFHLYVHEPLMRSGMSGIEVADEMLPRWRAKPLPLASPVMEQVHQHFLQHFIEQDVVGHMEADLGGRDRPTSAGCTSRSRSRTWRGTRG